MSKNETQKFYLIDASQLKQLLESDANFKERSKPLPLREMQTLDNEMLHVVNDPSLSTDDKVHAYNTILTKYQSINSARTPSKAITFDSEERANNIPEERVDYNPLLGISSQYQNKAKTLWSLLKHKIKVMPNGEISINGNIIHKSNISDLLNKAVNSRLKPRNLPGWDQFNSIVEEENIPKSLLNTRYSASRISVKPASLKIKKPSLKSVVHQWESHDKPRQSKKRKVEKS